MAKHSFPYKPICFKCKATSARARARRVQKEKTRWVNEVRGGREEVRGKEGREGEGERRKPVWKRTGTSGN